MEVMDFVEGNKELDNEEVCNWMKDIDAGLLDTVITFQKIVLVPKSRWLSALDVVNEAPEKQDLKEKLLKLISNLQAYNNENTKDILVPEDFKSNIKAEAIAWYPMPETFTKEDEVLLDKVVATIIGEEEEILDEGLQNLLKISKDMDYLNVALTHTKWNLEADNG